MDKIEYTTFDKIIYSIGFGIKAFCFIAISPLCVALMPFTPVMYYHLKEVEKEKKEISENMKLYYSQVSKQIEEDKLKKNNEEEERIRAIVKSELDKIK